MDFYFLCQKYTFLLILFSVKLPKSPCPMDTLQVQNFIESLVEEEF